jgi:hypothetical protein
MTRNGWTGLTEVASSDGRENERSESIVTGIRAMAAATPAAGASTQMVPRGEDKRFPVHVVIDTLRQSDRRRNAVLDRHLIVQARAAKTIRTVSAWLDRRQFVAPTVLLAVAWAAHKASPAAPAGRGRCQITSGPRPVRGFETRPAPHSNRTDPDGSGAPAARFLRQPWDRAARNTHSRPPRKRARF